MKQNEKLNGVMISIHDYVTDFPNRINNRNSKKPEFVETIDEKYLKEKLVTIDCQSKGIYIPVNTTDGWKLQTNLNNYHLITPEQIEKEGYELIPVFIIRKKF